MPSQKLVELCETKIRSGLLPGSILVTTLGGYSAGSVCAACDEPISPGSTEMLLQWTNDGGPAEVNIHPICFAGWAEAVRRLASIPP